jgi:hypothetical protein
MSRSRDPDSIAGQLRTELTRRVQEHDKAGELPTSKRVIYYEVKQEVPRLITAKVRPDNYVIAILTQLCEDGVIPWDAVDETRNVEDYSGFDTIIKGMLTVLDDFRLCPWAGAPPIVICESRSLAGVLRVHAREYRVLITSTNGQVNAFLRTKLKDRMRSQRVLYFGDYNRAGTQIEDNTRRILTAELGELEWERLALTEKQVKRYHLPVKGVIDRRRRNNQHGESVECEAMRQTRIVGILRDKLDALLPVSLERIQKKEERERRRIRKYLSATKP